MARSSDTREKVREIALQLSLEGKPITSRKIREILGAGSLSTITDELVKWDAERLPAPGSCEAITDSSPPSPSPKLTKQATRAKDADGPPGAEALEVVDAINALSADVATHLLDLRAQLDALTVELSASRKSHEEQLSTAYLRYEAVQRHAMVQIDDARQVAAQLRQRLASVTLDFETREDAQRGKVQSLREENVRLSAQVQLLRELRTPSSG